MGLKATVYTASICLERTRRQAPLLASHSRTDVSKEAVASILGSFDDDSRGAQVMSYTASVCAVKSNKHSSCARLHTYNAMKDGKKCVSIGMSVAKSP